ncbi:hypothetical protein [Amycolatopsis orientalis]|uniref:hypothetical protein n=1 Tax=Amycolatopsis orientalis TaxID=31958 RepID=UPI0007C48301|nr:hypothetical protein [Amycolatopsis orientalis]
MAEQAPRSAELLEQVARHEEEQVGYVRELLERSPDARVSDVDLAARIMANTVELLVHKLIAGPEPVDLPAFEAELAALLVRYATAGSERTSGLRRPVGCPGGAGCQVADITGRVVIDPVPWTEPAREATKTGTGGAVQPGSRRFPGLVPRRGRAGRRDRPRV